MKRLFLFAAAFLVVAVVRAQDVKEIPIGDVNPRMLISISTSAWTQLSVSTHTTMNSRAGTKINNPSLGAGGAGASYAPFNCTLESTTPTIQIGTGEIEIGVGENPHIPSDTNMKIWCVSLSTGAQNIYAREDKQ